MEEVRGHRGLAAQDGFHQGVVDENILLLMEKAVSERLGGLDACGN